jgi:hypothetical protein|tara:strand:- start:3047 stop:3223 length:177 start_codon:yes stop_codon:yes gene_type:complete
LFCLLPLNFPTGHVYWHNTETEESTWEEPTIMRERRLQYNAIRKAKMLLDKDDEDLGT